MVWDAVALLDGHPYDVPLGRRDGLKSNPWEVDLPALFAKLDDALRAFATRGFTAEETVVLLGVHTVGGAHCSNFQYRLTRPDGTMDEPFRYDMLETCGASDKPIDTNPVPFIDLDTPFVVDNAYYAQLVNNRTLLQIDQEAATHPATAAHVAYYATSPDAFVHRFSEAMAKLGNLGVLEGDADEVRKVCTKYNT